MTDRRVAERPLARAQMVQRRRRWAVGAGIVAGWILLLVMTGSVLAGTALLLLLVALGVGCVAGLRALGVDARRPWAGARDYEDRRAASQAASGGGSAAWPEPGGGWAEPGRGWSEPDAGWSEPDAGWSKPDAAWSEPGASWSEPGDDLGYGRDRSGYGDDGYRAGRDGYGDRYNGYAAGHDGHTRGEAAVLAATAATVATGAPTVAAPRRPRVPMLRLVTGDSVTQTQVSGARAGRGAVDLILPEVPTVSREHARFTFADGQWWVVNLGRNGLMLNGVPLTGAHPLRDGDSIHWGQTQDALLSRVEIG